MGTRTARTKLETKIRYQKEVIVRLQEALNVAHKTREKIEAELVQAKADIVWQKKRVSKRDEEIKEMMK